MPWGATPSSRNGLRAWYRHRGCLLGTMTARWVPDLEVRPCAGKFIEKTCYYEVMVLEGSSIFFKLALWTDWSNSSNGRCSGYARPSERGWVSPHPGSGPGLFMSPFWPWGRHWSFTLSWHSGWISKDISFPHAGTLWNIFSLYLIAFSYLTDRPPARIRQ